jgi:hypothetical protein
MTSSKCPVEVDRVVIWLIESLRESTSYARRRPC